MSWGVGHRCCLDPVFLWLWFRPVATALIGPLAWEPPYAVGAAQEIATTTTTAKDKKKNKTKLIFNLFDIRLCRKKYFEKAESKDPVVAQ